MTGNSEAEQPGKPPLVPAGLATIVDILQARAERAPASWAFSFLADGEEEQERLSFGALDRRARAIAVQLAALGAPGERALLLFPSGLDFIAAFFGCLYAQVVAVPAPPPRAGGRAQPRLLGMTTDARPRFALTTAAVAARWQSLTTAVPALASVHPLVVAELSDSLADRWQQPPLAGADLAFLQYTSGSTSEPKGVSVSHANLLHNEEVIRTAFGVDGDARVVGWLPLHHDMGLIGNVLQPVYSGIGSALMTPAAFLQRPLRWLRAISRYRAQFSGGPSFAYDLCVRKIPADQRTGLDLSCWRVAFNGAEPVRAAAMAAFGAAFEPCGFRPAAFLPCYGLAEATLMVTAAAAEEAPVERWFRGLDEGRAAAEPEEAPRHGARRLVGCGRPLLGQEVAVVDPATATERAPGEVGEIWVSGPSVALGYWERPQESEVTFRAVLAGGARPGRTFLRTGDLGFLCDGELFVAGRLKDLLILRGRNVYPQDVEHTVAACHPALRRDGVAAFSIEADGQERLAVACELEPRVRGAATAKGQVDELAAAVCAAVFAEHEVEVHAVALLAAGDLPRTSSGKMRRGACREAFLAGNLDLAGEWRAPAGAEEQGPVPTAPVVPACGGTDREAVRAWLMARLATRLALAPAAIDPRLPFAALGIGSAEAVGLAAELETALGRELPPTLVYDYPTIEALAGHLAAPEERPVSRRDDGDGCDVPMAVVGIGCRFPGAPDPQAFWRLLRDGLDAVSEVPAGRWDVGAFYDPQPAVPGKTVSRKGGFLAGIDGFDAPLFDIPPREAERMDPQQRLLLETAWEALEDAGVAPGSLAGSPTGVFAGVSGSEYGAARLGEPLTWNVYDATGNASSIAANRISYLLDLRGPSVAVDTACSSSLVAVHLACQSLRSGECSLALAGGVSLMLSPAPSVVFSQAGLLTADGCCKAFDARADGYVRGEGAGVVVLKPLPRALADGDPVYAVIRGSAVNQDGRSNGLTAPSRQAQEAVLRAAYGRAGIEPATVGYVEAHGAGTALGDPIEAHALGAVVGAGRPADRPCLTGSVKANIGHLEAAAGIAGLLKTVLALHHREIPRQAHFDQPSPHIPLERLGLAVPRRLTPWPAGPGPRRAGVSSFGFGGTNAHLVLEEAPEATPGGPSREWQLLPLSARSAAALEAASARLAEHLGRDPRPQLADVCFTLQTGRRAFAHRQVLLCRTATEAAEAAAALAARDPRSVLTRACGMGRRRIAFLLPGLGEPAAGMAAGLYASEPGFRRRLDTCAELLRPHLGLDLIELLYGGRAAPEPGERGPDLRRLLGRGGSEAEDPVLPTAFAQPALFAVEWSLAQLWLDWGVRPDALLGYSLGEYVAACLAGVLSLADALRLVAGRARQISELPAGAMLAVPLPAAEAGALAAGEIHLAAVNGPHLSVLSGPPAAIAEIERELAGRGLPSRRLAVTHAFHSPALEPAVAPLLELLRTVRLEPPRIPYLSNVTGTWITAAEATDPGYWARHMVQPVRFDDGLSALLAEPERILLEVGPGQGLSALVRQRPDLGESGALALATLGSAAERRADEEAMLGALGRLWLAGVEPDWAAFSAHERRRRISLPTYPFERQRYWIDARSPSPPADAETRRPLDEWFHVPVWRESPPCAPAVPRARLWLLLLDACGVGAGLAAALAATLADGEAVVMVAAGERFARTGPRAFTIAPGRQADYAALLECLHDETGGLPDRIVHLWSVTGEAPRLPGPGAVAAALERGFDSLLLLVQALQTAARGGALRADLAVIADHLESVSGEEALAPEKATVFGPCRVIPLEVAGLACRTIDLALPPGGPPPPALVESLLAELSAEEPVLRVALRGRRRWVQGFEPLRLGPEMAARAPLREGGVYLVTGGLGGLGLAVAEDLARRVRARLILVGRSGMPADGGTEPARRVQALRDRGTEVMVAAADVADATALRGVVEAGLRRFGALHGVVHAAGVPGAGLIETKPLAAAHAVLAPKVAGTLALEAALAAIEGVEGIEGLAIDWVVLFSSLAALSGGGPGQADYAAANAFLGAFAQARAGRLPVCTIDWGEWRWDAWHERAGLDPRLGARLRQSREHFGISDAEGTEALWRILARRLPQVAVSPRDLDGALAAVRSWTVAGVLEQLAASPATYPRPLIGTSYVAPRNDAERRIAAVWEAVLGLDRVGIHDNFFELGGNSLLGLSLAARLAAETRADVPRHLLYEAPTVAALAAALAGGAAAEGLGEWRDRGERRRQRRQPQPDPREWREQVAE